MAMIDPDPFAGVGAATLELACQFQSVTEMLAEHLDMPELRELANRMKLRNERWAADPSGREEMVAAARLGAKTVRLPKSGVSTGNSTETSAPAARHPALNVSPGG